MRLARQGVHLQTKGETEALGLGYLLQLASRSDAAGNRQPTTASAIVEACHVAHSLLADCQWAQHQAELVSVYLELVSVYLELVSVYRHSNSHYLAGEAVLP